jgi:hypothetical protein
MRAARRIGDAPNFAIHAAAAARLPATTANWSMQLDATTSISQ